MDQIKINMELVNQKVKFIGTSDANPSVSIPVDYVPPLGDEEGFLGLELLVMSFAGCVSTAIVAILRRMGKTVISYQMRATGSKRENPLSLERIDFEVTLESPDIGDGLPAVIKRAEEISPVWLAIKNNVEETWQGKDV